MLGECVEELRNDSLPDNNDVQRIGSPALTRYGGLLLDPV